MCGRIKENMMGNGKEIKCMEKEKQYGQMVEPIMESKNKEFKLVSYEDDKKHGFGTF
jgi:hypothetical protein